MSDFPARRVREALERAGLLQAVRGDIPATLTGVADDSRRVVPGGLFTAVKGTIADGHDYLDDVAGTAGAVIVEDAARTRLPAFIVRDGRRASAVAAAAAFDEPARRLRLVGVTGTNGKTTTVGILRHLLDDPEGGAVAASIGTLGVLVGGAGTALPGGGGLTTPGPVELQRLLRALVDAGVRYVAMEVSSHSLDQRRVEGVEFAAAVFTNLTRDHLDYHGSMANYREAKLRLAEQLAADGRLVVNAGDPAWSALPRGERTVTFALGDEEENVDVRADDVRFDADGSRWTLTMREKSMEARLPLIGDFNVANALGASAAAIAMGVSLERVVRRLASVPQVPGRLERLHSRPAVLRDYAHTPDALERALAAVRPFTLGKLIVLFGCGGDRDPGKRPLMGGIAERLADHVIVTSDNPRTEDPDAIIDDIERGMQRDSHERMVDRRDAIAHALRMAGPDDLVLLAGKGHETYQVRGTTTIPFDESTIVAELMRASSYWTIDRVRRALEDGGGLVAPAPDGSTTFSRIGTDTRGVVRGELFVALTGERFDGNDFLDEAVAGGAAGVVTSRASAAPRGVPAFVVRDTTVALGALGRFRRRDWGRGGERVPDGMRRVIAVAGSNGKTSTKELIAAALASRYRVHATRGNLNNQVGVPLTLLAIPGDADIAVVEVGTNAPGEIALLRAIVEPDIAVVTSIGEEHLEGLGDLAGVLREESAVFDGAAVAITPASQPEVANAARGVAGRVVAAGLGAGDLHADEWGLVADGTGWARVGDVELRLRLLGTHNLRNAMLALAVARECGVPLDDAARGISKLEPLSMRSSRRQFGAMTVLDDAYNSNPASAREALAMLVAVPRDGRRTVAVLGTMLELGPTAPALHDEIASLALASDVDVLAGVGEFANAFERLAPGSARVVGADDAGQLWPLLQPRLTANAIVLLKGSRGTRLERLIPLLADCAARRGD
ncbi:MAG TPA: UDP-N-acetylmuramoyl-L-alanyl-D-glutamate--2,6-diaminopimelate ligase [Gemmatimonadaceae bacterium]|nr:UDP-N-acetylmuramoyl-L-alanyl-D-glutamate--2,6-diaminopimelate ligase [Gemmatimonadaceae bacterium]